MLWTPPQFGYYFRIPISIIVPLFYFIILNCTVDSFVCIAYGTLQSGSCYSKYAWETWSWTKTFKVRTAERNQLMPRPGREWKAFQFFLFRSSYFFYFYKFFSQSLGRTLQNLFTMLGSSRFPFYKNRIGSLTFSIDPVIVHKDGRTGYYYLLL